MLTKGDTAMKPFFACMLAILIALTALGPLGAFAEAPELNSESEQIILEDDALELPEDYDQPDLSLDDGLVLDDLQLLDLDLTDGGGKEHRAFCPVRFKCFKPVVSDMSVAQIAEVR